MTSIYNGQFSGHILVVGKTGCGKTTFLETLGKNFFFGNLVKTKWTSGIDTDEKKRQKFNHALVTRQKFILQKNRMNLIL